MGVHRTGCRPFSCWPWATETAPSVFERTLEFWRHQGLLPYVPSGTARSGSDRFLELPSRDGRPASGAAVRLRQQTKDPNVLRAALSGTTATRSRPAWVRDSIRFILSPTFAMPARRSWPSVALDVPTTQKHAGKRFRRSPKCWLGSEAKVFRAWDTTKAIADAAAGIALTLGLLLGEEEAMRHLAADAPAAERLIGVDRGRRFRPDGAGPWLDGPPEEGLESFANTGGLNRLIAVVGTASDGDWIAARRLCPDAARRHFGVLSDRWRALVGRDNASGMGGMRMFYGDPRAALLVGVPRPLHTGLV